MRRTPLILAILGVLLLGGVLAAGLIHRSPAKSDSRPVLKVASQKGGSKALVLASGVLEGAPYDVEWSEFPSAAALLEALSSHAVDVGAVGDAPFMFAYASGATIKVVQTSRASGGGTSTAVLVRKDSPLTSAAQLRGKRIATGRGSIGHYLLLRVLEREGLKPTDVKIVFLNPGDAKAAFSTGAVDAWVTWGAYVGLARLHDEARVLADGEGLLSGLNFQAASEKAIAEKSPQLTDFLRRLALAQQWAGDHQPAYAATLAKETGLPLDVAAYTVAQYRNLAVPIDDGVIAEERRTIDHFSRAGALTFNRDLAGAFDARFNAALKP